ncbi:MAG: Maf family protein [Chloroflexota bacterium]
MKEIILASSSPRRKELLRRLGLKFRVAASDAPEIPDLSLKPIALAKSLALGKARAVAPKYPGALIIAADTIGVLRGKVLGKPEDTEDARKMLSALSGKTHTVITGLAILDAATGKVLTQAIETKVTFRRLSKREVEAYVATCEPLDKAGAYAIQGRGALLIREIQGDYFNVMGLPLSALCQMLKRFGVYVL